MPVLVPKTARGVPNPDAAEWIDQKEAAAILKVKPHVVRQLDALGRLTVREVSGVRIRARYRRDEIVKLAGASVRPAIAEEN